MKKIIITSPNHTKEVTQNHLSSNTHLFNTSIRPFDFALKPTESSRIEAILSSLDALSHLDIPTIKDVVRYPATLESLLSFLSDFNNYNLKLSDLPTDTDLYKDIYKVLEVLSTKLQNPLIDSNTTVSAYLNALDHSQVHFLNQHNITNIELPHSIPKSTRLKYSLNVRHEIEAVVQEIIDNDIKDATVAIPNLANHIPLIESVLLRYGINSKVEDRSIHLSKIQYLTLIEFAYNPTRNTLTKVLESNALNLYSSNDILFYINHFDLSLDACLLEFNHAKDIENTQLMMIQNQIQDNVLVLQAFIREVATKSYIQNLEYCYEILKDNPRINTQPIYSFLMNYSHLFHKDKHAFLTHFIDKISAPLLSYEGVQFHDLSALPFNTVENLYVLNLNGSNYPSISGKTGLIDELYLSKVKGYPGVDVRTQYSLTQQSRFLSMSKNLTLSYSVSTYEGKGLELSYPIETYCKENGIKGAPWDIKQVIYRGNIKHSLTPQNASKLYLTDGKIVGSISSFELYTQDPLAYFLERGLKLREPELPQFDSRVLGTLNHAIVEYMDDTKTQELWNKIFMSFPEHSPLIQMIKLRNDAMMTINMKHLKEVDKSTYFNTMSREKYFISHAIHPKIELRGIIDRVDYTDSKLMIIDYKSSALTLSAKKIMAGQQLQLLTYALISRALFQKEVLGVFYYGFKLPTINHSAYKYTAAKGLITNETTEEEAWIKEKQLSGWFFEMPTTEFESATHFKGFSEKKDGSFSVRGMVDYTMTQDNILQVYDDIQNNILKGVLDLEDFKLTLPLDTPFKPGKED